MDGEAVPSSLVEIVPILRLANEVEPFNLRVAFLCRNYALNKAIRQDPRSTDPDIRKFKSALHDRLERQQETSIFARERETDALEMQSFYQQYYKKHFEVLQNATDDLADHAHCRKVYRTASVLRNIFEVLKTVSLTGSVEVDREILESHTEIVKKMETYSSYGTLQLEPGSSGQAMLNYQEVKQLDLLKIPLYAIKNCTEDFSERNIIGKGGYGRVYKGILSWADHKNHPVAVKRLDVPSYQGHKEFFSEVTILSQYRHKNIITLIGICDDNKEMILVYEYASRGSLDKYLTDATVSGQLSWPQLLEICISVAHALDYLHNHTAARHRIIHRDIKSSNILLDENWNAKLSDFGLSRIGLANQENTFVITDLAGTPGYCDPQYERTGILTKESDVYSFGVVLFEVLCGRLAYVIKYKDERTFLAHLARKCYEDKEMEKITDERIMKDIKPRTLSMFSSIAYECLEETREERPTITQVVLQLKEAKEIQLEGSVVGGAFSFLTVHSLVKLLLIFLILYVSPSFSSS